MKRNQRKSLPWRRFGYVILIIKLMNFCFDFLQELSMLWEAISNTRKSVSSDIQTLRSCFKRNSAAPHFFRPTFQCLDIWWDTLRCLIHHLVFAMRRKQNFEQVFAHSPSLFLSLSLFASTQYLSTFDASFFPVTGLGESRWRERCPRLLHF